MAAKDKRNIVNPFLEDNDNVHFCLQYKGKRYNFNIPILYDKSFLLHDIKSRTGVRRAFSIRFVQKTEEQKMKNKKSQTVKFSDENDENLSTPSTGNSTGRNKSKGTKEFCIHSTNLTTLSLVPYAGETLYIIDTESTIPYDDPYWLSDPTKRDPVSIYTRKFIRDKFDPIDCPP